MQQSTRRVRALVMVMATALAVVSSFVVASVPAGADASDLVLSTTSVDFGSVNVGSTASQTVTVTNSGASAVTLSMAGGAPSDPFSVSQDCATATLAPGGTCHLFYTFTPTTNGVAHASSDFDFNGVPFSVALTGTGVHQLFSFSTLSVNFGLVREGTTASHDVVVTNVSGASITVSVTANPVGDGIGETNDCDGVALAPAGTCRFAVTFTPVTDAPVGGGIVGSLNGQDFTITTSGQGIPLVTISPTSVDFGPVPVGTTATREVTVTNASAHSIIVSGSGGGVLPPFNVAQNCQGALLAAGASCTYFYSFSPTTAGLATATSVFTENNNDFVVPLRGTGSNQLFSFSTLNVDFGAVPEGALAQRSVVVTNVTAAPIAVTLAGGTATAPFSASNDCAGATLAPGGTCTLTFGFQPADANQAVQTVTGMLNTQPFSIDLRGVGIPPITVSTTAVDFGPVAVGGTVEREVAVTNASSSPVLVDLAGGAVGLGPFNASQDCNRTTLAPGASCHFFYTFSPTAVGSFTASSGFIVNHNSFTVTLSGIGVRCVVGTVLGCDFTKADLHGADLHGQIYALSLFTKANLRGANMRGMLLVLDRLSGADLTGADLTGARIVLSLLDHVVWSNTTCPDGTNSDAHHRTCQGHLTPKPPPHPAIRRAS